jgi:hypothetical protein
MVTAITTSISLYHIILVFIIAIVLYLAYKYYTTANDDEHEATHANTPAVIKEGFTEQEITDLLDKMRVNLYERVTIWDNMFYNYQPDKKEKQISFWKPLNDSTAGYRLLGHCVSDTHDSPKENTMLVLGDTKPPVEGKLVFSFPDNIITAPKLDEYGAPRTVNPLVGIKVYEDLEKRIQTNRRFLDDVVTQVESIKTTIADKLNLANSLDTYKIEVYGKDSMLSSPVKSYNIKPGQQVTVDAGEYNGLRIPVGCEVTLIGRNNQKFTFSTDFNDIVDQTSGQFKSPVTYTDVYNNAKTVSKHDFKVFGHYGLAWRQGSLAKLSNENNQKISAGGMSRNVQWPYQYGFGNAEAGLSGGGKAGLVPYFENVIADPEKLVTPEMETKKMVSSDDIVFYNKYGSGIYFPATLSDKKIFPPDIKRRDHGRELELKTAVKLQSPHIHTETVTIDTEVEKGNITAITDTITRFADANKTWFTFDSASLETIKGMKTKISDVEYKRYYTDLTLRLPTFTKKLRLNGAQGAICPDGNGCNCCSTRTGDTVDLHRIPALKNQYLKSAIIKMNFTAEAHPFYRLLSRVKESIYEHLDKMVFNATRCLAELEDVKRAIDGNTFSHFPMKIIRPVAPPKYVNIGDLIFNHQDPNFSLKTPIMGNIACVPEQCIREVRDWLAADKVYEYVQGDIYLAIYRNPHMQTFRAVTTPGMLPPGRVEKVVACVEKCRLLDDIIEADKCSKKFYKANKSIRESANLDSNKILYNRESALYNNTIQAREEQLNVLREAARKLQLEDDKADLVNKEYNRNKLQTLVDKQRNNISKLADRLSEQKGQIEINVKFNYGKFSGLIYQLRDKKVIPPVVADRIVDLVDQAAKRSLEVLPTATVSEIIASCPTPNTEGLVVKALVESGCYNCKFD